MNANRLTTPKEKVRQLQEQLGHAAKRSKKRKFHALYDKVYRMDILQEAWKKIRANKGAPGVDGQAIEDVEQLGVQQFLEDIQRRLIEKSYPITSSKEVCSQK